MSEVEIKQMQKKIEAGIQLARKRLIEKTKKRTERWSSSATAKWCTFPHGSCGNRPPEYGKAQDRMVLRFLHPALFAVGFLPSLQIRSPTRISYPIKSSRHPYTIRSHEPWPYHHHQNTLYRQISQQNKPPA